MAKEIKAKSKNTLSQATMLFRFERIE